MILFRLPRIIVKYALRDGVLRHGPEWRPANRHLHEGESDGGDTAQ